MTLSDTDPSSWPARRAAAAIAAKEISAREYLTALLDRVDQLNGRLNLVVTLDERALRHAGEADEAVMRGDVLPPLHGVAMTVKDCFMTAGLRTTGGLSDLAGHIPREDAGAVAGARRAGVIVYGKTNVPEGSGDLQTYNGLFGTSGNPWRTTLTTSGSSGGAAGAVAAGLTPAEIGSDVAGSIRLPAASCGVFGHKPSFAVVSTHGLVPPFPYKPVLNDLAVAGPLARDVDDLETLLLATAGPHPWDRSAWHLSLPPARPVRRVAAWFDDPYCPVDDEVRAALEYAADLLADSGVQVRRTTPPAISLAFSDEVFRRLLATVAVHIYDPAEIDAIATGSREPRGELGAEFVAQSHHAWMAADEARTQLRRRWAAFFSRYDAIMLPVAPNLTPAHDHRPFPERTVTVNGAQRPYWDQTVWAGLTTVGHLPSTVVPVRLDSRGAPIGVAIAGPYLGDRTTLAVARALARVLPPIGRPPLPTSAGHHPDPTLTTARRASTP